MTSDPYDIPASDQDHAPSESEESLGRFLKRTRLEQGKSLEEIAERIKIHASTLMAIEEDNQRAMPAEVFARGFIKSYAKYLGLDPNEALEGYIQQFRHQSQAEQKINAHEVLSGEALAEVARFPFARVFLFLAAAIGLVSAAYWAVGVLSPPVPPQEGQAQGSTQLPPPPQPAIQAEPPAVGQTKVNAEAELDDSIPNPDKPVISPEAIKEKPGQTSARPGSSR